MRRPRVLTVAATHRAPAIGMQQSDPVMAQQLEHYRRIVDAFAASANTVGNVAAPAQSFSATCGLSAAVSARLAGIGEKENSNGPIADPVTEAYAFVPISEEELQRVPAALQSRVRLADVNNLYAALWQYFVDPKHRSVAAMSRLAVRLAIVRTVRSLAL